MAERHDAAVGEQRVDGVGERAAAADDGVHARRAGQLEPVLAEHGVRVGVPSFGDGGEHVVGDDGAGVRHPLRHVSLARRAGRAPAA